MNGLTALRASLKTALQVGRNPVLLVQQSLLEMAARDHPQARANAEEVLRSNPRDERVGSIVAESYLAQNQTRQGIGEFDQPGTCRAGFRPHSIHARPWAPSRRHLLQAREQFEAAHRNNPVFTASNLALADLDRRQGRVEAAKLRLSEVIAKDRANVDALLLLADIERSSGDHAAAIARYRAVLGVDSSNLMALNNLSTELTSDSPDEAIGFAQRAFDLAAGNPAVQDTLGWIYCRKGFYRVAAQHLQEAMAKEPNPRRQLHLGFSYIKTGDLRQGRELLKPQPGRIPVSARSPGSGKQRNHT
jgi:Tfp pilus assembly protein PilF